MDPGVGLFRCDLRIHEGESMTKPKDEATAPMTEDEMRKKIVDLEGRLEYLEEILFLQDDVDSLERQHQEMVSRIRAQRDA